MYEGDWSKSCASCGRVVDERVDALYTHPPTGEVAHVVCPPAPEKVVENTVRALYDVMPRKSVDIVAAQLYYTLEPGYVPSKIQVY